MIILYYSIIKGSFTVFKDSSFNERNIHPEYVALPPTKILDLSLTIGVLKAKLLVTGPIPPSPENFVGLPFFEVMSNTEDNLPPNSAGILPL